MARLSLGTPRQRKVIVSLLVGIVGLALWWRLFLIPQCRTWRDLYQRAHLLNKEVDRIPKTLAQLPALKSELSRLAAQYNLPAVAQPPEEQLPELLETISQMAKAAQVQLISVKPQGDFSKLIPGPSGYLELPIQVEASAGYHQIGLFLDTLEHSDSFVRLQEMKIQADPKDIWHPQVTLILRAYLLPGGQHSKPS